MMQHNNIHQPIVQKMTYRDPLCVFAHFANNSGSIWLDSAELRPHCGRYSFIAIDPFMTLTSKNGWVEQDGVRFLGNPWQVLKDQLESVSCENHADLPPFQ